jgi:hypothetical protein
MVDLVHSCVHHTLCITVKCGVSQNDSSSNYYNTNSNHTMPRPSTDDIINNIIDPTTGKAIHEKILHDLNPERRGSSSDGSAVHNFGQPRRPPHASSSSDGTATTTTTNTATKATTAFLTHCAKEHGESLQCIERNYQNRSACEEFFQAYKQCRKNERKDQEDAANKNKNSGWWFW